MKFNSKRRWLAFASVFLTAVGCSTGSTVQTTLGARSEQQSAPTADDANPTPEEIADRLQQAYEQAKYIHFDATTIQSPGIQVDYTYDGTPDSFRAICFKGKDKDLYRAFSFYDGRVQEYVPEHPKRLLLAYDADAPNRIPWFVYTHDEDCLFGLTAVTWVGKDSLQIQLLVDRIRESKHVSRVEKDGRACYMIDWQQSGTGEHGETHTNDWNYYIDAGDFVVRRMKSTDTTTRDRAVVSIASREFVFHTMELSDEPKEIDFDVWRMVGHIVEKHELAPTAQNDEPTPR